MSVTPLRVLLVEDDAGDYEITRRVLVRAYGKMFSLEWADSYESALVAAESEKHDLYLLDYHLGPHTGVDLLRELRQCGNSTPAILLTGLDDHDLDLHALEAGAADYLVKDKLAPPCWKGPFVMPGNMHGYWRHRRLSSLPSRCRPRMRRWHAVW